MTGDGDGAAATAAVVQEDGYAQLREELRKKEQPWNLGLKAILFIASLGAFVAFSPERSPLLIGVIVAVLAFHEAGHFVAMKLFGYEDLNVFFVPFFGAGVSGHARNPGGWRAGVVSLAGPLPGLLVGAALLAWADRVPTPPVVRLTAVVLVLINGVNLLPFEPLDGGRLMTLVLFSRHKVLEMVGIIAGTIGLIASGVLPGSSSIWAGMMGGFLVSRFRLVNAAHDLRQHELPFDGRTSELPAESLDALTAAADPLKGALGSSAGTVRMLHQAAATRPAPWLTSLALFSVWAGAAGAAWVLKQEINHPTAHWSVYASEDGRWRVEFPGPSQVLSPAAPPPPEIVQFVQRHVQGAHGQFVVVAVERTDIGGHGDEGARQILREVARRTAEAAKATVSDEVELARSGRPALRATLQGAPMQLFLVYDDEHLFSLSAIGSSTENTQRFFDSFELSN